MSKMLFELSLPTEIAKAKEDLGIDNLWKYLRYIRMFMERSRMEYEGKDVSYTFYNNLLWGGVTALVKDNIIGLVIAKVVDGKKNVNGDYDTVDLEAENGWKRKNVKVGKDCVLCYADETRIPPIIYIWALANEVISIEDIIRTQNNMLRKPILVDGIGADLDDAMVRASNVLSGVAFINKKGGKSKSNVMDANGMEVLNLQVGNSYKGAELWASRKNYEEFICDYLGYPTAKNEKRERVNVSETNNENSIGMTFYASYDAMQRKCVEEAKSVLDIDLVYTELISKPEESEGNENGSDENEVE